MAVVNAVGPHRAAGPFAREARLRLLLRRPGFSRRPKPLVSNVHVGEQGPNSLEDSAAVARRRKPVELPPPPPAPVGAEPDMATVIGGADDKAAQRSASGKVMREVLSVALPALGTVLADPLMSLVDTACVGQLSSVELAALGPNTAIFNFVFQLFTFLGLSTANIIASRSITAEGLSSQELQQRREKSERIMCYALTLAAAIGIGSGILLYVAGPALLRMLGSSAEIIPFALPYLRIRSLASPAVMVTMVAQGACLGQQDMWTPLKVVLVSGLINLIGDMHLILNLKMGTVGAALATTAAQYAGAIFFLWYLRKGGNKGKGLKLRWKGLPTSEALKPMFDVGQVLLARIGATMMGFTAITTAATMLGTIAVAGHQVMLQVFWLLSYFPEPFSLTAQTLIAKHNSDRDHVRTMSRLLMRLGSYTGVALALVIGAVLTTVPFLFSSDAVVISTFQSLVPQAMISLFICSVAMMCDGIHIGSGQIEHLPTMMTLSMLTTVAWVWGAQALGKGLGAVWWGMVAFFVARVGLHALHIQSNWSTSPCGLYKEKDQEQQQQQQPLDLDPAMNHQIA